jgi:hypothetical protein
MAATDANTLLGDKAAFVAFLFSVWYDLSYRNKGRITNTPLAVAAAINEFWTRFPKPSEFEYSRTISERKHLWRVILKEITSSLDVKPKSSLDLLLDVMIPELQKLKDNANAKALRSTTAGVQTVRPTSKGHV